MESVSTTVELSSVIRKYIGPNEVELLWCLTKYVFLLKSHLIRNNTFCAIVITFWVVFSPFPIDKCYTFVKQSFTCEMVCFFIYRNSTKYRFLSIKKIKKCLYLYFISDQLYALNRVINNLYMCSVSVFKRWI